MLELDNNNSKFTVGQEKQKIHIVLINAKKIVSSNFQFSKANKCPFKLVKQLNMIS